MLCILTSNGLVRRISVYNLDKNILLGKNNFLLAIMTEEGPEDRLVPSPIAVTATHSSKSKTDQNQLPFFYFRKTGHKQPIRI